MARIFYTDDHKAATLEMYMNHSRKDTALEMGVSTKSITTWYKKALAQGASPRTNDGKQHSLDLIHCACQHYTHHVWWQTCEVFNISPATLYKWRFDYGYSNKHYGRNMSKDKTDNDVATLHAKAMAEVSKQKDAYRDKMREFEELIDGLRSDASSIQHKMFDFMQSLNDE